MSKSKPGPPKINRRTAERRLANRYAEQNEAFPLMAQDIPLKLYIQRNIKHVMNGDAPLADYDQA